MGRVCDLSIGDVIKIISAISDTATANFVKECVSRADGRQVIVEADQKSLDTNSVYLCYGDSDRCEEEYDNTYDGYVKEDYKDWVVRVRCEALQGVNILINKQKPVNVCVYKPLLQKIADLGYEVEHGTFFCNYVYSKEAS